VNIYQLALRAQRVRSDGNIAEKMTWLHQDETWKGRDPLSKFHINMYLRENWSHTMLQNNNYYTVKSS